MTRCTLLRAIVLLSLVGLQRPATGSGSFGADDPEGMLPPECGVVTVALKNIGTDLPTPAATYVTTGRCNIRYSTNQLGRESTFDNTKIVSTIEFRGEGTYQPAQKNAWEDVTVRQTYLDRPGFFAEGKLTGWGTCARDPWRDPDGMACGSPGFKTAGAIEPAVARFYGKALRVPLTSNLTPQQRASLKTAYQAAVHKAQQLHVVEAPSALTVSPNAFLIVSNTAPTVVSPTANQLFNEKTPIPIKLTSPKGLNAASYTVNLQTKGPAGNWIDHATIPVGVAQAQSAAGYTGFGAGAPPAFLALPGAWRMNAQVSSPKVSPPSAWVEFTVRSTTRVRR